MSKNYTFYRKSLPYILSCPTLLFLFFLILYPIFYTFKLSFQNVNFLRPEVAEFVGFDTFKEVLSSPTTYTVFKNTLIWTGLSTFLIIFLGILIGSFISQDFYIIKIVRATILIPWVLPGVVVAGLWKWMYHSELGVINKVLIDMHILDIGKPWLGFPDTVLFAVIVVIVWRLTPLFSLVVSAAIQGISQSIYEAGEIDGVNKWQKFFYLTLPQIKYPLYAITLLVMIWVTNNLVIIFLMTGGGPLHFSETLPIYLYKEGFMYSKASRSAAIAVINFFMLLGLSAVYIKVLVAPKKR